MTIRFVVRTDEHVSDEAPSSRTDDYMETCLDKLRQIGEIASDFGADAVLDNGDFFHKPGTKSNSHDLVKRVVDVHDDHYDCPVYENPGNHDFPYTRIDYVDQHALGVLFSTGVFDRLDDMTFYDSDDDVKVRVVGIPYQRDLDLPDFDIERKDEDVLICAAHTFASKEGGSLWGDHHAFSYFDLADCTPDAFIFGHWHIDQGIETVKGTKFMNLGSMTRGALVKDNLDRIPRVGRIEVGRNKQGDVEMDMDAVELDVRPSDEIFDLDEYRRTKHEEERIDQFVESLSRSADVDDNESVSDFIDSMDFSERVKETALHYIKQAGS